VEGRERDLEAPYVVVGFVPQDRHSHDQKVTVHALGDLGGLDDSVRLSDDGDLTGHGEEPLEPVPDRLAFFDDDDP